MKSIAVNAEQLQKVKTSPGFIAALDQSGGSTPKALRLYGVQENTWSSDEEMFAIVHQMRTRIITSPGFNGKRITDGMDRFLLVTEVGDEFHVSDDEQLALAG